MQYNSWHTGAGIEGTDQKSYWWRREWRWEMVELKGHQQQEMEGKLQGHSWLMWMAQVLVSCCSKVHIPIFESLQLEGSCEGDLLGNWPCSLQAHWPPWRVCWAHFSMPPSTAPHLAPLSSKSKCYWTRGISVAPHQLALQMQEFWKHSSLSHVFPSLCTWKGDF